ncbi:MAG: SDR family NAD(P)-dependent oxidoreductase [Bacteroidales bacterium]|nr:SDR family NAD(P)-dependent oxidoreductase [Bacteroidales bacterium]
MTDEARTMKESYALVTGASSGIGYQFSREMGSRGYDLIIVSNESEALSARAESLRSEFGVKVIDVTLDLGVQSAAQELYSFCTERKYEVEVLINNAGVYHDRDFLKDSEEFNSLILNLHVYTPAMLEYYFGKDMVTRGKGYILNVSSITSDMAIQRMATYSATKAFLRNFSRSTHIELFREGVSVTCVRPGAVATGLYNLQPAAMKAGLAVGYIITPEKLARKAVDAMFKGRIVITPGVCWKLLGALVRIIPAGVLKLIRKLEIF